jgi:hypothetical protein
MKRTEPEVCSPDSEICVLLPRLNLDQTFTRIKSNILKVQRYISLLYTNNNEVFEGTNINYATYWLITLL